MIRLTISKKLNILIGALQVVSISASVLIATKIFSSNITQHFKSGALDQSGLLASRIHAEMKNVADRVKILASASFQEFKYKSDQLHFMEENLASDTKFVSVSAYRDEDSSEKEPRFKPSWRIVHPDLQKTEQVTVKDFEQLDSQFPINFKNTAEGKTEFRLGKMAKGLPIVRIGLPFIKKPSGRYSQILVVEIQQGRLDSIFSESTSFASFLVDRTGTVLSSSDVQNYPVGQSLVGNPSFEEFKETKHHSAQKDFKDQNGKMQIGAFQRLGFGDLVLITQIPTAVAAQAEWKLFKTTGLLGAASIFIAILAGIVFSEGIAQPIRKLAKMAGNIRDGDLTARMDPPPSSASEEIKELAGTFNQMVAGLQERDRIKSTFAKFHSREVAEKVLSGELKLGGERKEGLVLFCDVRDFTQLSEKVSPETLVSLLNRYMTKMVRIILEHGGVVDKYMGDAIMALWGIPISGKDDTKQAVRACLKMRVALQELNKELEREGQPQFRIGMGLNYGNLVAGNIGSDERMEYTVIGDTVNIASRIEELTKHHGCDFLVSQNVMNQAPNEFVYERVAATKVKGKSEPISIYKVTGIKSQTGVTHKIETAQSHFKPSVPRTIPQGPKSIPPAMKVPSLQASDSDKKTLVKKGAPPKPDLTSKKADEKSDSGVDLTKFDYKKSGNSDSGNSGQNAA